MHKWLGEAFNDLLATRREQQLLSPRLGALSQLYVGLSKLQ